MNQTKETILMMIFWGFMITAFTASIYASGYMAYHVGNLMLQNFDEAACLKLQQQALDFKDQGFYITQTDAERCTNYEIQAPVQLGHY